MHSSWHTHHFSFLVVALYGKYRPKNFDHLVGQESIKTTLRHAVSGNLVSHAYLFCGSRGTGKTSTARILAKAINCTDLQKNGNPCGTCEFCRAADEGRMTDLIEIDAASNRGIDEIRDLRDKIAFAPNFGRAKIYIIDEVHMLTKEAFNALLKTLEEPPSHAYFILATTEFHKVPETIRSRCQTFFFKKITKENIIDQLEYIAKEESFAFERSGIEILADRSDGGLRDAISLLEQCSSYGPLTAENLVANLGILSPRVLEEFFHALVENSSPEALKILDVLQEEGRSLEEFSKQFLGFLREKFHEFLGEKSPRLSWILEVIDIFIAANAQLRSSDIPPLPIEIAIAKTFLLSSETSLPPPPKNFSETKTSPPPPPSLPSKVLEPKVVVDTPPSPPSPQKQQEDALTKDIHAYWKKICDEMPSSVRTILSSSTVKALGENEISVMISSETFRDRVLQKQEDLEKVCSEVMEKTIKVQIVDTEGHDGGEVSMEDFQHLLKSTL